MTVEVLPDHENVQGVWIAPHRVPTNGGTSCSRSGCPTGRWSPSRGNLGSTFVEVQAVRLCASKGGEQRPCS